MSAADPRRLHLVAVLAFAVFCVSLASPLIRIAAAPAAVIAFWRMFFSTALTAAAWVATGRGAPAAPMGRRDSALAALAGVLLAVHFHTWITSLSLTSLAASVFLVNTQPLFAALLATWILREPLRARQWAGIAVAVAGAGLISLDAVGGGEGSSALAGDFLAVIGAMAAAGYYAIGRRLRPRYRLWPYITRVYGVSAVCLLGVSLGSGLSLFDHPAGDWGIFLVLAIGPGLLGHTLLNWTLRWLSAPVVNVAALGEPIWASGIAALLPAIGEIPGRWTIAGGAVTLAGITLVLLGGPRPPPASPTPGGGAGARSRRPAPRGSSS